MDEWNSGHSDDDRVQIAAGSLREPSSAWCTQGGWTVCPGFLDSPANSETTVCPTATSLCLPGAETWTVKAVLALQALF